MRSVASAGSGITPGSGGRRARAGLRLRDGLGREVLVREVRSGISMNSVATTAATIARGHAQPEHLGDGEAERLRGCPSTMFGMIGWTASWNWAGIAARIAAPGHRPR